MEFIVIQRSSLLPNATHAHFVNAENEENAAELIVNHPHDGKIIRGNVVDGVEVFKSNTLVK